MQIIVHDCYTLSEYQIFNIVQKDFCKYKFYGLFDIFTCVQYPSKVL